jgi:hypothetical protein
MLSLDPNEKFYCFHDKDVKRRFWAGGLCQYQLPETAVVAYITDRWGLKVVNEEPYFVFLAMGKNNKVEDYEERLVTKVEVMKDTRKKEYIEVRNSNFKILFCKNKQKVKKSERCVSVMFCLGKVMQMGVRCMLSHLFESIFYF